MMARDRACRPAPDGVRIDPWDHAGDEHDPADGLEVGKEPPAEQRRRRESREVGGEIGVCERQHYGHQCNCEADGQEPLRTLQGERDQQQGECRRDEDERQPGDVPPDPLPPEVRGDLVVGEKRREQA